MSTQISSPFNLLKRFDLRLRRAVPHMDRGLSHGSATSSHLTRRGFLTAAAGTAGAVAAAPLLAACGTGPAAKTGATSAS